MPTSAHAPLAWYRVPVVWLGILIFAVSIVGCIWIIAVSAHYRDEPVATPAHAVLGMPVQPRPASPSS